MASLKLKTQGVTTPNLLQLTDQQHSQRTTWIIAIPPLVEMPLEGPWNIQGSWTFPIIKASYFVVKAL